MSEWVYAYEYLPAPPSMVTVQSLAILVPPMGFILEDLNCDSSANSSSANTLPSSPSCVVVYIYMLRFGSSSSSSSTDSLCVCVLPLKTYVYAGILCTGCLVLKDEHNARQSNMLLGNAESQVGSYLFCIANQEAAQGKQPKHCLHMGSLMRYAHVHGVLLTCLITHTYSGMQASRHVHDDTHAQTHAHAHAHTRMHMHTHCTYIYMHTYMCIHIHIHTERHRQMHTHTPSQASTCERT